MADRGEFDGSTFTDGVGVQEWTLDILGNWTNIKQDLDGDGNFTDNKEDEDRDHNKANEITSLDINGLIGSPFTQHSDKAGNWTRKRRSNSVDTRYTHDAWNRLVKVELGTVPVSTKGEYEYNGLHWRTVKEVPDGSDTEERRLFYSASWQLLEERIDSDNSGSFAEEKASQTVWGLRYIDDAVLRRSDINQDYDYADSGERTDYYITDPQFSVCAVISDTGALQERVSYSAYGEAQHHFPADMDGDGDVDSTDINWFLNSSNRVAIDDSAYNPDGDLNRDGAVNTADIPLATTWNGSAALADGQVSDPDGPDSPVGYDGYLFNAETKLYTVRFRHYEPRAGRWLERDPLVFTAETNWYASVYSRPLTFLDTLGLIGDDTPQWHHLLPNEVGKHIDCIDHNSKEWGLIMPPGDHRWDTLHARWNREWKSWRKELIEAGQEITDEAARSQLRDMLCDEEFKEWLKDGIPADVSHSRWKRKDKNKHYEKLAKAAKDAKGTGRGMTSITIVRQGRKLKIIAPLFLLGDLFFTDKALAECAADAILPIESQEIKDWMNSTRDCVESWQEQKEQDCRRALNTLINELQCGRPCESDIDD